jgi:hypothetical protein
METPPPDSTRYEQVTGYARINARHALAQASKMGTYIQVSLQGELGLDIYPQYKTDTLKAFEKEIVDDLPAYCPPYMAEFQGKITGPLQIRLSKLRSTAPDKYLGTLAALEPFLRVFNNDGTHNICKQLHYESLTESVILDVQSVNFPTAKKDPTKKLQKNVVGMYFLQQLLDVDNVKNVIFSTHGTGYLLQVCAGSIYNLCTTYLRGPLHALCVVLLRVVVHVPLGADSRSNWARRRR